MKQHIISPSASLDLSEIIDYFAIRNIEAGERFVDTSYLQTWQKRYVDLSHCFDAVDTVTHPLCQQPLASRLVQRG